MMLLKDAMIVWTPNRGPLSNQPLAGSAAVTTIPEDPALKAHPKSVGACELKWREADHAGRLELLQGHFTWMVRRDQLDEAHAREVLSQIEDIDVSLLDADAAGPWEDEEGDD